MAQDESFEKSVDKLIQFGEMLKIRCQTIENQRTEAESQVQVEKRRFEELQQINRTLTEQLERSTEENLQINKKYSTSVTRCSCLMKELEQIKAQNEKKQSRINELDRIVEILRDDKIKAERELEEQKKLQKSHPTRSDATLPDEVTKLIEAAVEENNQLKKLLETRDEEISRLKEQINQIEREDPQLVEQRLCQSLNKLKNDFRLMYEKQSKFFLEKLDLLKEEQRENLENFSKH